MLPTFLAIDWRPGDPLPDSARRHIKSRRIQSDEPFLLLDGRGHVYTCTIADDTVVPSAPRALPSITPSIELCVSPPRGDALSELAAQATEIGATALRFVRSDHNQFPKSAKEPPAERAQRVSDAACEQCARAWRMPVATDWHELEALLREPGYSHVVCDEALAGDIVIGTLPPAGTKGYRLYLGPEGGWSETERQLFGATGAYRLSLGPLILRVPTAAVAGIHHLRLLERTSLKGLK